MTPPRFTVKSFLAAVAIAGVAIAFLRQLYTHRFVSESAARAIKPNMTALEVRWRLGAPHSSFTTWNWDGWDYSYSRNKQRQNGRLILILEKGTDRVLYIKYCDS